MCCSLHDGCTVSYPVGGPMSSVEHKAASQFMDKMSAKKVDTQITHVLSDGCRQINCGLDRPHIENVLCTQHIKRGQMRNYYSQSSNLSSGIFGTSNVGSRKKILGKVHVDRCSVELRWARTSLTSDKVFCKKKWKVPHKHCSVFGRLPGQLQIFIICL